MSTRVLAAALHLAATGVMSWGYLQLSNTPQDAWIQSQKGAHLQFLTIQGLGLAWTTMVLSVLTDVLPTSTGLKKAKRSLFMIAMPLAVVISSIYWTLLLAFPNLILPKDPRLTEPTASSEVPPLMRLPLKHDLALHAAPGITLFLDFILFEMKYSHTAASKGAPLAATLFCVWYSSWVEYCASFNGAFPYPFLTENPFPIRMAIYMGATLLALGSFRLINGLRPAAPLLRASKLSKAE